MGNQLSNPNISSSVFIPSAFISRGKKKGCVASREVVRRTRRLPERYHESSMSQISVQDIRGHTV